MTTFQITTFTGSLQNQSVQLINARELHQKLENGKQFSDWIQHRISKYKFSENLDFIVVHQLVSVDRGFFGMRQENIKEYHITLDMAKELCMLERSELGQQARRYFIQKEKEANALKQAQPKAEMTISTTEYIELLKSQNTLLKQSLKQHSPRQAPKALTLDEKQQILLLSKQGLSHRQIAEQIQRSPSAVRSVIRENV
ncbi:antA/AntB antirepressor family protein [Ursidibacter sp. B-7004-1]